MSISREEPMVHWDNEDVGGDAVELVTLVTVKETTALEDLVSKFNASYQRRRYLAIVQNKEATSVADSKSAPIEVLKPAHPIRPERSRLVVERFLAEARKNRAPECSLYLPSEGKFLCVSIDTVTGKHFLQLLEGGRFFPSVSCGKWRVLPADRNSKDKLMLLQNCFSNKYVGHDMRGMGRVDQALPTKYEHLELVVDEATGYLKIICPHWHWERGAPLVVKGPGKQNPNLWPSEVNFLEWAGDTKYSENPHRTLRCGGTNTFDVFLLVQWDCILGFGGRQGKTTLGYVPALFQVVWDLPEQSKRAASQPTENINLNWLGQNNTDFSQALHQSDPNWRSPYKARVLGLLP